VTNNEFIKEAEIFIDTALTALNGHSTNRAKVQLDNAPIARTNRITTSHRFQEYAAKLKNMIPTTIEMPVATTNVWKRRPPPTMMNLTDDTFPPLDTPKKQKTTGHTDHDTVTTTDPNDSLTDLDINKLERRQTETTATFTEELAKLRQENETMQQTLQTQFQSAMQALELRMEQRTQSLVSSMGHTISQAVEHMNTQTARSDECLGTFLASFQAQADRMSAQVDRMMNSPDVDTTTSHDGTPVRRTKARLGDTMISPRKDILDVWDMDEDDDESADGSRKSHASRVSHPNDGMDTTTGGRK
jgi:hypothetical protein